MIEVHIEIGMSGQGNHRYIGVQSPLLDEQRDLLVAARREDGSIPDSFRTVEPDEGQPYSQAEVPTYDFHATTEANNLAVETAHKVARILSLGSDDDMDVTVDETPHLVEEGSYLFGGVALRLE